MKGSSISASERLRRMHDRLVDAYGPQFWWPAHSPFEVILGAYLTQNTSWKAVEVSLKNLSDARALTVDGLRSLTVERLGELIRPSGFYTRKAPALKAFLAMLDAEFEGSLERLSATPTSIVREKLLALPGIGPETADAILLYALGHPVPVADEYLRRILIRHKLLDPLPRQNRKGYEAMTQLTQEAFHADLASERTALFNEFHALTVAVGKAHCGKTANCDHCPLAGDLKYAGLPDKSARPASTKL